MKLDVCRIEVALATQQLTKVDFSQRCGITRQNLSTILRRGTCEPRTAGKIASALGVPVEQIIMERGC